MTNDIMTTKPKLLSCPFCGGAAESPTRFDIKCTACGAAINSQTPERDWNTRNGSTQVNLDEDMEGYTSALGEAEARVAELESIRDWLPSEEFLHDHDGEAIAVFKLIARKLGRPYRCDTLGIPTTTL